MEQIFIIIFVLSAVTVVGLILLHRGKGADIGASFGGGGSQALFGPGGGTDFLTKVITALVIIMFTSCFIIAVLAGNRFRDAGLLDIDIPSAPATMDAAPASDIPLSDTELADPVGDVPESPQSDDTQSK